MAAKKAGRLIDVSALSRLSGLQFKARSAVEGYYSGIHKSPYHGASVEFAEYREYSPGDELKRIDWRVFGKTDRYFVKLTEAETNLNCYLLLDASGSMEFGTTGLSRLDYGSMLCAAIALLFLRQGDNVGLVTYDSKVRDFIPPRGSARHFMAISDKLENLEAGGESKISPVLHHLAEVIRRRSLVIVLSDFFDNVDDLLGAFAHFRFKHHEIIALHLMDDAEMDFPIEQPTLFECMEQSRQILADPRIVRQSYLSKLDEFMSGLRQGCRRQDVDYQLMRLSEPFDQALATYLARRSVKTG